MPRDPFDEIRKMMKRMMEDFWDFDEEFFERGFEDDFFEEDFGDFVGRPEVSGFHVEIRDTGDGEPEINVERLGEPPSKSELPAIRPVEEEPTSEEETLEEPPVQPVEECLETNTSKAEKPDEVVLTVKAPDVKEEDVDIRRVGDSLEVLARRPDNKAYFATFGLPSDADVEDLSLEAEDDLLIVTVPRTGGF